MSPIFKEGVSFEKMQALGNDFVVIDGVSGQAVFPQEIFQKEPQIFRQSIQRLAHRRFGVGCDQVLWLVPSALGAQVRMRVFNADGSEAETCGNGLRAVALWLLRRSVGASLSSGNRFTIESAGEVIEAQVSANATGEPVRVSMVFPPPRLMAGFEGRSALTNLLGGECAQVPVLTLSVGNPHAVIFVESPPFLEPLPAWQSGLREKWGPSLERHAAFPHGTNVEFVWVKSPQTLQVEVWERGAGPTWACGTGGMAAALAAIATGRVTAGAAVEVIQPGGTLWVEWAGGAQSGVKLTGPAEWVFRGSCSVL